MTCGRFVRSSELLLTLSPCSPGSTYAQQSRRINFRPLLNTKSASGKSSKHRTITHILDKARHTASAHQQLQCARLPSDGLSCQRPARLGLDLSLALRVRTAYYARLCRCTSSNSDHLDVHNQDKKGSMRDATQMRLQRAAFDR